MLSWKFVNIFALLAVGLLLYLVVFNVTGPLPNHLSDLTSKLDYSNGGGGAALRTGPLSNPTIPQGSMPLSPSVAELYDQVWSETPSPFAFEALKAQCARTTFKRDVYLRCKPPYAGLTTIMSQVKVCLRLAVDTGSNLVMPTMARRDDTDLKEFNRENPDQHIPFGDWFDEPALIRRLGEACPELKIARLDETKLPAMEYSRAVHMNLGTAPYYNGVGNWAWPGRDWATWWNDEMARLISDNATGEASAEGETVIVDTLAPLSFFNIMNDVSGHSLKMWNEMNYLIRFKPLQRDILHQLVESLKGPDGKLKPYYGVHFRTEGDSPDAWIKADVQIDRILEVADRAWTAFQHPASVKKVIYLACGDTARIAQFEQAANERGWQVIDKYRLSSQFSSHHDLHAQLVALPFDYQGMIDLGLMMLSEFFIGLTNSAFSFSIAHARDPRGRYAGSTLQHFYDEQSRIARTHLFDDGEGAYPCCL